MDFCQPLENMYNCGDREDLLMSPCEATMRNRLRATNPSKVSICLLPVFMKTGKDDR